MGKGLFEEASRLPKWALPLLIVALVVIFFLGPNLPDSGVVQLEATLVQADGFLLAFLSVAFTSIVGDIKSQNNDLTIEQRKKLSKQIRVESIRSFFLLIIALISAVAILTNAIAFPNAYTPEYFAYAFPLIFTILGLYGIFVAMSLYSKVE